MSNLRIRGKACLTVQSPHIEYGDGVPSRGEQLKQWTLSVQQCAFAAYPQVLTRVDISYDHEPSARIEFLVEDSATPKQVRDHAIKTASDMYIAVGTTLADQLAKDGELGHGMPARVTVRWIEYEIC